MNFCMVLNMNRICLFIYFIVFNIVISNAVAPEKPILFIISFDAFRYNYFLKNVTPNLLRLRRLGTYAEHVRNVFPTKTFPNHQTISTGLYPEVHGVIGNSVLDPAQGKLGYEYGLYHQNDNIVPIWTLNQRVGHGRHSASMMWPGANFPYQNITPTFVQDYDRSMPWERRIDIALEWVRHPTTPANLVMFYIEEPDSHAHAYGPESDMVTSYIKKLDDLAQYFHSKLNQFNLTDKVNVIHLSDHGMSSVAIKYFINLTDYMEPDSYTIVDTSPVLHIFPKPGKKEAILKNLTKAATINKHFNVYDRDLAPPRWHFRHNSRIAPIVAVADIDYAFQDMFDSALYYQREYNITPTNTTLYGIHGYDNSLIQMHPFFMARGPLIKINHQVPVFDTVDMYSLFCDILNLEPGPHNGSFSNVQDILKAPRKYIVSPMIVALGGAILSFFVISCAAILTVCLMKRKQTVNATSLYRRIDGDDDSVIENQHLFSQENEELQDVV